jgi:hypothetical protein
MAGFLFDSVQTEVSAYSQKVWMFTSACIIAAICIVAILVVIWWFVTNFTDYDKKIRREECMRREPYAQAADDWLYKYYQKDDELKRTVKGFNNVIYEKNAQIAYMEKWDEKRIKRISELENQLRENGIEPTEWKIA